MRYFESILDTIGNTPLVKLPKIMAGVPRPPLPELEMMKPGGSPEHPDSYYRVAERIHRDTPNSILPNQYANQANPRAHYETTGPEIWRDTDGTVTHFVCGMGTGGTISGVGKFLKEKNPKVQVIGVDPLGSILKDFFYKKEPMKAHTYKIEGIGEDFVPESTWFDTIDEIVKVGDKEAYLMTRRLAREEGVLAGSSSGAAVVAARRIAETLDRADVMVVLLPDTGERYLSKAHLRNPKLYEDYVAKVMEKPSPIVEPGAALEQVYKLLLRGSPAVVVGKENRLEGIITRIDVIEYLAGRA